MALTLWASEWTILLLAALFAFFSLFRYSVNLGFVERPLVQGVIWGLIFGRPDLGLNIGIFFELLWLDLFPAGTFIPPQSVFAVFASVSLGRLTGVSAPEQVFALILACIPLAFAASWLENKQREWQNKNYNLILRWASRKQHHAGPEKMVLFSLGQQVLVNTLFAAASLFVLLFAASWLLPYVPNIEIITWPVLWLAAAVGGIMSLRLRRAYTLFFCGLAGAGGIMLAGWLDLLSV